MFVHRLLKPTKCFRNLKKYRLPATDEKKNLIKNTQQTVDN